MKDKIIIRPMYKTDLDFHKGMEVAVLESTGEVIKRHFDNVLINIPEEYKSFEIITLGYEDIDWELASYVNNQMFKIEIREKNRNKLVKSKKYESEETFLIWKKRHTQRYSNVYEVLCFRQDGNNWIKI